MEPDQTLVDSPPIREVHAPRLRLILSTFAFLVIAGAAYYGYTWYNAPLQVLARQEASILQEINASKKALESLEAQMQTEHQRETALQTERAKIEQQKIAEANRGVKNPAPIAPFTPAP